MKVLICDSKKIQTFILPQKPEKFFVINFDCNVNNNVLNETITLKSIDNKWKVYSDLNVQLKTNGSYSEEVTLSEFLKLEVKFADINDYMPVYIMPDYYEYDIYSTVGSDEIKIGSSSNCKISITDAYNEVAVLTKKGEDYRIKRIDSRPNSCYVNKLVFDERDLKMGDTVFVCGIKIIYMGESLRISKSSDGVTISLSKVPSSAMEAKQVMTPVTDVEKNVKLYEDDQVFIHTPRLKTELKSYKLTIDSPPQAQLSGKTPWLISVGSTALMSLTSIFTLISSVNNYMRGTGDLFSLISQMVMAGGMLVTSFLLPTIIDKWQKKQEKKNELVRQKRYREYIEVQKKEIERIIAEQESVIRENNYTLENIVQDILETRKKIWSRETFDSDFLSVTLGIGSAPALIEIEKEKQGFKMYEDQLETLANEVRNEVRLLNNIPVNFSILNDTILPFVIHSNHKKDFIKAIMLQLIYYYSAKDLKIITITDQINESYWDFMKYVPHSWDNNHDFRYFASNLNEVNRLSTILDSIYESRANANTTGLNQQVLYPEYYVIVTDDYKLARELSVVQKLVESGSKVGFGLVIFEDSIKELPSKFDKFVDVENDVSCIMQRQGDGSNQVVFKASYIDNFDITRPAQIISNIPIYTKSLATSIPSSLTFLDMFHVGRVEQLSILSRWAENNPVNTLRATLGVKDNDRKVELDLHEKYHGPHGLIAGTTGSGKSEFIITYLLSLAVNYHPYEVQFVLIDYKGGGLAGAFENRELGTKIPHLVGTITNLDKSEMNRTLVSINSELQRRQRVFNETREALEEGTIDIYKYQRFYREGKVKNPMSHLFIVADEFAELKAQQPEFMDELVSAARIGRSLGVHLILATQKPSGVVDDQIWSNSRFKICLKVQTIEDSNEMLKRPEAAYIKESGRFYLQVGNDEIFEMGQAGWAGAKYIPSDIVVKKVDDSISFVVNDGSIYKSVNEEVKKEETTEQGEQLTNIVKYLYDLAKKENINFSSLWLDNIPPIIYYNDIIKKYGIKAKPYVIEPTIGEFDDPANQRQGYVSIDLTNGGNVFIAGVSGSGKTTLLSTIIYSSIINHTSDELNIYVMDFGAEKLRLFRDAPQVGEVLSSADGEKVKYLFYMLMSEREKRLQFYTQNGGDFFRELKVGKTSFPTTLVLINDMDVFKEYYESLYDEVFASFTRSCNKVGITFIVTGSNPNSLGYMAENNFPQKILMNLLDDSDYGMYLKGSPIPKKNPGRGVVNIEAPFEFQSPLIFDEMQSDKKIKYVISELNKYLKKRAPKIPSVPDEIDINAVKENVSGLNYVPLGVNLKTAQYSYFNFDRLLTFMCSTGGMISKLFFTNFFQIASVIENTKVIALNSTKGLEFDDLPENIKCYSTGFAKVIQVINKNIDKYIKEESDEKFLIVLLGYTKLQKELAKAKEEDPSVTTLEDLILKAKNSNNFRFIIYEPEEGLKRLETSAIGTLVKNNSGIWLGKDIDNQEFFDYTTDYSNEVKLNNSTIVLIKNGSTEYTKYL